MTRMKLPPIVAFLLIASAARGQTTGQSGLIFVSNEAGHSISVIDVRTSRVESTIPVPSRPRGIQTTRDGKFVFVAVSEDTLVRVARRRDAIAVIDVATRRVVRELKSGTDPEQFAVTPNAAVIYASNEDAGTVSAIDVRSGKISSTAVVGIEPEGVAVSPDGRWVYITAETSNSISVIDVARKKVVANLLVDARPRGVAFSPDSRRAYVTAEIGGSVTMIDVATREIITSQPLDG